MVIIFIIILALTILFNMFNGAQDVGNSRTEIMLRSFIRRSSKDQEKVDVFLEEANENSDRWHSMGFITYLIFSIVVGLATFPDSWFFAGIFALVVALMRATIFNPIVAKGVAPHLPFYRLGDDAWEAFWKKYTGEKVYYFGAAILQIALTVLIFNRGI